MSKTPNPFSLKQRLKSFRYAFSGIRDLLRFEHNSRVHLAAAILATILGLVLHISPMEWLFLVAVILLVFITELFNSAIEDLADHVSPELNKDIKRIKDYCAAAVLLAAILSVVAAAIIFIPKIITS